jgi:hypothetical protein
VPHDGGRRAAPRKSPGRRWAAPARAAASRRGAGRQREGEAGARAVRVLPRADGFDAWLSFVPPPQRRGLVLIDPPYEAKNEARPRPPRGGPPRVLRASAR